MTVLRNAASQTTPAPSRAARWRAAFRIARRQSLVGRGGSVLVVSLIALPVLAATLAFTYLQSTTPTAEQHLDAQLGRSDAMVVPAPHAEGEVQMLDSPWTFTFQDENSQARTNPVTPAHDGPPPQIPSSAKVVTLREGMSTVIRTPDGLRTVRLTAGAVWDPPLRGRFAPRSGSAPTTADEAMVSPALLTRLDAAVGDQVRLQDGTTLRITGTLVRVPADPYELFVPGNSAVPMQGSEPRWYVSGWHLDASVLRALNDQGYGAYVRSLVANPPPGFALSGGWTPSHVTNMLILVAAGAGTFLALLTALLAATALSVSAQRQQRSLAIATSVGAQRRDVFRIVLLQGGLLAVVGAVIGLVLGIVSGAAFIAFLDQDQVGAMWGDWGLHVPWAPVLALAALAVVSGVLAALTPARRIAGGDPIATLRGSQRPAAMRRSMPRWGLTLFAIGLAVAGAGAALVTPPVGTDGTLQQGWAAGFIGLIAGTLLASLGFLMSGHWLLFRLARAVGRGGVATRVALRDSVAHPARVIPAFTAIAVSMVLATYAISSAGLGGTKADQQYSWSAPLHSVVMSTYVDGIDAPLPSSTAKLRAQIAASVHVESRGSIIGYGTNRLVVKDGVPFTDVFDAAGVEDVFGVTLSDAQRKQFEAGAVLLVNQPPVVFADDPERAYQQQTVTFQRMSPAMPDTDQKVEEEFPDVPVVRIDTPVRRAGHVISPATAVRFGYSTPPTQLIMRFADAPSAADQDRLVALDTSLSDSRRSVSTYIERGPMPSAGWIALIGGVASLLVLGAAAVSLGLARYERRADDATLAAVGGDRGLRRQINAVQALVIVGFGTIPGALLGLLPAIGQARVMDLPWSAIPWIPLAALAVGLPLVICVVSWLIPPRRATLTHRTVIT